MDHGPLPYIAQVIDTLPENKPGVYILGNQDDKDELKFHRKYVGRSDTCLRTELKNYLGTKPYGVFWFSFAANPLLAFIGECLLFHTYLESLDNKIHPDQPNAEHLPYGLDPKCWVCKRPFDTGEHRQSRLGTG